MRKRFYNPYFTPMQYSPALWLDASDASSLVMDGARTFVSASTQYLYVANNSSVQTGNVPYWFSCWVKLTTLTGVFACKAGSGTAIEWQLSLNGANKPAFDVCNGASTVVGTVFFNQALSTGAWYHILVYLEPSTSTVGISLNGGAFATASLTGTPATNTQRFVLGAYGGGAFPLNGSLDSCAFGKPASGWLASNADALASYLYNGGSGRRSSDFLASSYYTGGNPSGAVSWWDMDARSGNETDRIGSNNLTDNGGVGYAAGVASGLVQYTGDPVKQWQDKSGNARHVTAASDAVRPTYVTGVKNSLPGIRFDKLNDYLTCESGIGVGGLAGYTAFGVLSYSDSGNQLALSANNSPITFQANVLTSLEYVFGGPSIYGSWAFSASAKIITHAYDGSQTGNANRLKAFVDGTQKTLSFTGTIPATLAASTSFTLGIADSDKTTAPFGGDWLELIVVPSVLDSTAIIAFQRYLGNKWGITVA